MLILSLQASSEEPGEKENRASRSPRTTFQWTHTGQVVPNDVNRRPRLFALTVCMALIRKVYLALLAATEHPLKRGHPVGALAEFFAAHWQARRTQGTIQVAFPNETTLIVPARMKGAVHFISPGLCEFDEMCFVVHYLRADELFADVGANIGAYTVLASAVAKARTIAFEPSPWTFANLEQNIAANDLASRVSLHNAAVGRAPGKLRLTENLGTENYVCPEDQQGGGVEVKVVTLDDILGAQPPGLMKVDVEGFETEVFAGAGKLLKHPGLRSMIVERSGNDLRYGFDETKLHAEIRAAGFVPCAYSALQRELKSLPADAVGNIIYVRDRVEVQMRLRQAPAFRFAGKEI